VAAAAGIAAGTAVGAAVIAAAATNGTPAGSSADLAAGSSSSGSSGSSGTTTSPPPPDGAGHFGGRDFGMGFGPGGPIVHGEFTIQGPNGTYENLQEQTGTVTSITNTSGNTWSLKVTSADGTVLTYVIDSGTSVDGGETGVSSIAQNDTVRVLAVVSNGTATAKQINDSTVLKNNGQAWMPAPPSPGPGSGSSSTTTS
jgi:hypothetical protein